MKKLLVVLMLVLVTFTISKSTFGATEDSYTFLEGTTQTLLESNLFTKKEDYEVYDQPDMDMTGFELALENEDLALYINPVGLAVRVYNKASDFYWASDINSLEDYELTGAWIRRIQSAITIDYLNETNISISASMIKRRSNENAEYSYSVVGGIVVAHVDFVVEEISMDYTISLEGNDVTFEVLRDSIVEYGDNRLTKLYLYEFFGTVNNDDVPGYYFIPSGNGALLRFEDTSSVSSVYRARFYSQDKYRQIVYSETGLNYPVFGAVFGVDQNALFTTVENGAEYAEYVYTPPTYQTTFHSQNVIFLMRENYSQPLSGGTAVTIYESEIKDYSPKIKYTVLDNSEANYVGFANAFKADLIEQGILDDSYKPDAVGMHVDILMQEYEQGLLFKNNYIMTSIHDVLSIDDTLTSSGVENIQYSLRGFNDGSYSDRSFDNYGLDGRLGDFDDLSGLDVEFYYDPTISYSYSARVPRTTLKMVNKLQYVIPFDRGDYYGYMTDLNVIVDHFEDAYQALSEYGGIALDGLSNELNSSEDYSRHEVDDLYGSLFSERMSMYKPDFYNLAYTSQIYMSNLYHMRARFFTDSVPFEQILLSGMIPVYSQFLNFSSNIHVDVLKMIEYGIMPAFLITYQPSYLLNDTMSNDLYATYFGNLDVYMTDTYHKASEALSAVMGHQIVGREVLEVGVVKVIYDNGYAVYVNYTNEIYSESDFNLEPMGFVTRDEVNS